MALAAGVLGLAVLGALLTDSPGGAPGVLAVPVPDHVHVVHRGLPPAALPRPLQALVLPVQRRRVHVLDPRTAINLVNAHESRRRRGSKRPPPPYRGPRPGPPRPGRYKAGPKRKAGPREKPWNQVTRGSSPAATRVRYQSSKSPRKSKTAKKSKGKKSRPLLPTYADGYADADDIRDLRRDPDEDSTEDRPRRRPSKSSKLKQQLASYPQGWGPDGGYRVLAPKYPPYGTDEEEPGTGHLDLEERFINQHNQFYRHGYPADSAEGVPGVPTSTKSKRKPTGLSAYEDEEIEVAEASDFADGSITSHTTRQTSYRRPSKTTRYSLQDGTLHEADSDEDYRRPSKGRGKKKHGDSKRHQSMYHAKFRGEQDDRTLSAANFNYELSGAASETQTSVNKNGAKGGAKGSTNNHRPAYEETGVTDVRTVDTNFFRTRKPQYWG